MVVIEPGTRGGGSASPLARAMLDLSLPGAVLQVVAADGLPTTGPLAGKTAIDGKPTAYACLGPICSLPMTEDRALADLLRQQRAASTPT